MIVTEFVFDSKDEPVCQIPPVHSIDIDSFLGTVDGMLEKYGLEVERFVTFGETMAFSIIKKEKVNKESLWSKDVK